MVLIVEREKTMSNSKENLIKRSRHRKSEFTSPFWNILSLKDHDDEADFVGIVSKSRMFAF